MKSILSFLFVLASVHLLMSQGVAINTDDSDADASAILDVKSTTQGALFPRMTLVQRDAITSPATGLTIYQMDGITGLYNYDGSGWVKSGVFSTNGANAFYSGGNVGIGTTTPSSRLDVNGDLKFSGSFLPIGPNGFLNFFSGNNATTSGLHNFGWLGGSSITEGNYNVILGNNAGFVLETGGGNIFMGVNSGGDVVSGSDNVFIGSDAAVLATGSNNVAVGRGTIIPAGINNATAIGPNTTASVSNTVILGNGASVGIGTSTPARALHVNSSAGGTYTQWTNSSTGTTSSDGALFGQNGVNTLVYNYENGSMDFTTNNTSRFRIEADGILRTFGNFINNDGGTDEGMSFGSRGEARIMVPAVSTSNNSTEPQEALTLMWQERSQNLGSGEGVKLQFSAELVDASQFEGAYIASRKPNSTDASTATSLIFAVNNGSGSTATERMSINSDGRIGLSMDAATNLLEVNGTASKAFAGDWLANSDRRIKTDIQNIDNSIDIIKKIRPVKFKYTKEWMEKTPTIEDKYYYNFIAQEYKEVFPTAVKGSGQYLDGDPQEILQIDTYDVQITGLKALQELIYRVEFLEKENLALKRELIDSKSAQQNIEVIITELKVRLDQLHPNMSTKTNHERTEIEKE